MSAILNFDASQVAPDSGIQDPLPAGWYNTVIDQSELKPTKDGTGNYLEIRHNVIDGAHANKKVYGRLNLRNANPTAQEIGYKQLSAVCHAVGVLQVQDSAQLHNIPLKIKLKLRAASGDYEASNEIVSWKNINEVVQMSAAVSAGFPAAAPTPPAFAAPMQAPAAPFAPPQQFAPPVQQAPMQQPAQQAPMQQPAQQQAPQPAQQQWQQPQAPQPWQQPAQPQAPQQPMAPQAPQFAPAPMQPQQPMQPQAPQFAPAPVQQPVQQPAPVQQPVQQAPVQQAPQQPAQQPAWNGAQTATPPWMQPAQPAA